MKRMAYFGTCGCPGHYFMAISGEFTSEEIYEVELIDQNNKFDILFNNKYCFNFFYIHTFRMLSF